MSKRCWRHGRPRRMKLVQSVIWDTAVEGRPAQKISELWRCSECGERIYTRYRIEKEKAHAA